MGESEEAEDGEDGMGSVKDIAGEGVGKEMNRGVEIGSEREQGPQGRKKGTGRRPHTKEFS